MEDPSHDHKQQQSAPHPLCSTANMEETTTTAQVPAKSNEGDDNRKNGKQQGNDNFKNNIDKPHTGGEKRKRPDPYALAYDNVHYEPIQSNPQEIQIPGVPEAIQSTTPGTPLRQFKHSFHARMTTTETNSNRSQIIHQHANGLCIVTAGSAEALPPVEDLQRIEFLCSESGPCSTGERRKKNSKRLKKGRVGSEENGLVAPNTEIARVHLKSGNYLSLYAHVWGTILELNTHVTLQQFIQDPLMEGYLAVVLPTGPFPPPTCVSTKVQADPNTH